MWDMPMTVAQVRAALRSDDQSLRDEVIVRLLREANSRDVFLFIGWDDVAEAWDRVVHRLGRSRPVWELALSHHRRHDLAATG